MLNRSAFCIHDPLHDHDYSFKNKRIYESFLKITILYCDNVYHDADMKRQQ